ncbi:MAG: hypothetical protein AAFQ41_16820 [Cyanobacteria bacterium J06623_7]
MSYFYFSSLLAGLLFIAPTSLLANEEAIESAQNHQYPAEFVQDFEGECVETSLAEGLDEADAQKLCKCTISEFENQYSLAEFEQLTAVATTDPTSEAALIEVGQFCFEQILYAE